LLKTHNLNAKGKMQKAKTQLCRDFAVSAFCILPSAFCLLPSGCALFSAACWTVTRRPAGSVDRAVHRRRDWLQMAAEGPRLK
jgi:hypothetical protein